MAIETGLYNIQEIVDRITLFSIFPFFGIFRLPRYSQRSLMEQVVHFLDRARKSLDILHEKSSHKDKSAAGRVPLSRSVHVVDADSSPNRATSASPNSTTTSRFARVKPSAQTSYTSNIREFTWSLFRRTDPAHCTPPRRKPQDHFNRTYDDVTYRRPELDPNEIPPEKLSQEAFRYV